ncbi:hypothetical protein Purlil1_11069 [Purpureocillium lilacinum]|uniref:Uncharacterized protein n=1 Tax=Purpureocillium lilacinum TaxID=33203 RepID=A0ABR0BKN2_PURLI|nr:hypothetical protein Purlil1_11069 [Purpureocillium lilacinum]
MVDEAGRVALAQGRQRVIGGGDDGGAERGSRGAASSHVCSVSPCEVSRVTGRADGDTLRRLPGGRHRVRSRGCLGWCECANLGFAPIWVQMALAGPGAMTTGQQAGARMTGFDVVRVGCRRMLETAHRRPGARHRPVARDVRRASALRCEPPGSAGPWVASQRQRDGRTIGRVRWGGPPPQFVPAAQRSCSAAQMLARPYPWHPTPARRPRFCSLIRLPACSCPSTAASTQC